MLHGFEEYTGKSLSAAQVEKLLSTYIEYCHSMSTIRKVFGHTEEWESAARDTIGRCVHILCEIIDEGEEELPY